MSNNRLELQGLNELRAALRQLPVELVADAAGIVDDTAEISAAQLRQAYPKSDTGNLRAGVKVVTAHEGRFGHHAVVKSASPHAHLWEFGTQNRVTSQGWKRGREKDHKPDGLVAIAQRNRPKMNNKLADLVRAAGFEVTGTF